MSVLIADAQALVGDYLRHHTALAPLVGNRVATSLPSKFNTAWVKVTQIGAIDRSVDTDHAISFLLQFDCYAGDAGRSVEADLIGRTVRAALRELHPSDLPGWTAVVMEITGPRSLGDDTDFEPARSRTLVTAEIILHRNLGS